ncbi:MAG: serine hydrolase [Pyrinomonadaceae bacterium]
MKKKLNLRFRSFAVIFLIVVNSICVSAQKLSAPNGLEAYLKSQMQKLKIPGLQIAIVKNAKIVMQGSYGIANLEDSVPVTNKTVFSINSATKSFTGVAIMQLVEVGKVDLDAPISRYLDGLPTEWQPVKVRQLLAHTSGIPDIIDRDAPSLLDDNFDASLARILTLPMEFKTGDRFSYNQTNYLLIGKIIDKLSGQPFIEFIKERQFKTVGMTQADWGDFYDVVPNKAKSYHYNRFGDNKFTNNYEAFSKPLRTGAGINTTAHEIAQWMIALQSGKLLQKSSLPILWKSEVSNITNLPVGYAMGFPTIVRSEHPAVAGIGGGRSAFFIYPDDDMAIVILTNRIGASPESFIDEVAGFYIPDMKASTGFGLPPAIKILRAELLKVGFEKAVDVMKALNIKYSKYQLSEGELNQWGYVLLRQEKPKESLEIFKLNVVLYPESGNVYDSLAEAYEVNGDKSSAIKNYKRSLELDPKNGNAVVQLKRLESK